MIILIILNKNNYDNFDQTVMGLEVSQTDDPLSQAKDNYDIFDQTIMDLEASQTEDPLNQPPQPANHYEAVTEETCYQCFTPLTCN